MLGLVREGQGIAARVLERLGVSLERLRWRVIEGLRLGAEQVTDELVSGEREDNDKGGPVRAL